MVDIPTSGTALRRASRAHSPAPRETEAIGCPGVDVIIKHQRDLAVPVQTLRDAKIIWRERTFRPAWTPAK